MKAIRFTRTLWLITANLYRYNTTDVANTSYFTGLYLDFRDKRNIQILLNQNTIHTWNGNSTVMRPDECVSLMIFEENKYIKLNVARTNVINDCNTRNYLVGIVYAE